jgi:hypothetical protein
MDKKAHPSCTDDEVHALRLLIALAHSAWSESLAIDREMIPLLFQSSCIVLELPTLQVQLQSFVLHQPQ